MPQARTQNQEQQQEQVGPALDNSADPTLQKVIVEANKLIELKAEVLGKLQEARVLANSLIGIGIGDAEQQAWVAEHLPRKKYGPRKTAENGADAGEDAGEDTGEGSSDE